MTLNGTSVKGHFFLSIKIFLYLIAATRASNAA